MFRAISLVFFIMTLGNVGVPIRAQDVFNPFGGTNPQKEIELGRMVARDVEKTYPLSKNTAYQERVRRIGSALVDALPQKAYPYEFKVLAVQEFNAFCLPGGFMYVYEGLLTRLPDDNAVAFVMAHEMQHAYLRHWAHHMEKMKGITLAAILAEVATGNTEIPTLVEGLLSLQYSRGQESEADRHGMELAWAAGFDPDGAIEAAKTMMQLERGSFLPGYFRDHPRAKDRLKYLQAEEDVLKTRTRPALKSTAQAPDVDLSSLVGQLPDAAPALNPWFPLAVGNEWTYTVRAAGGQSGYTIRIASAIQVKANTIYRVETVLDKDTIVPCQMMSTATELWRRNRPTSGDSYWQRDFVLPPAADQPTPEGASSYSLLSPEPVTTPCGTFTDTLHLHKQTVNNILELWFAKGIGLVKRVSSETGITETLASYQLKG